MLDLTRNIATAEQAVVCERTFEVCANRAQIPRSGDMHSHQGGCPIHIGNAGNVATGEIASNLFRKVAKAMH